MARAIASLAVSVKANTSKFRKGMSNAKRSARGFGGVLGGLKGKLLGLGTAIAGIAGTRALTALVKSQFKAIDSTAKWADKLGIAVEQLTGLRQAAELTGVSAGTLDTALQRMTRRVSEASLGTGSAKNAIKELGLVATDLARLSPDEQFKALADAMRTAGTQGDRVRLSMALFDTEGVALVNTLKLGSKGLEEVAQEAELLGLTLNRVEAAKIEMANDAVTKLKSAVTGAAQVVAVKLAPVITKVTDGIVEWIKEGGGAREIFDSIFRIAITGAGQFLRSLDLLASAWNALRALVSGFVGIMLKGLADVAFAVEKLAGFIGVDLGEAMSTSIDNLAEGFGTTAEEAFDQATEAMANFVADTATADLLNFLDDANRKAQEVGEAIAAAAAPPKFSSGSFGGILKGFGLDLDAAAKAGADLGKRIKKGLQEKGGLGGVAKDLILKGASKLNEFLNLGKGKKSTSFVEVDLTKQSLGLQKEKEQKTTEKNSDALLNEAKKTNEMLGQGIVAVVGK